jgi:23S rRNA (uracil1939-C5)-methyltransferase
LEKALIEVEIESLGALGDGCGYNNGKPVYIPFTLAGDVVEAEVIQENSKLIRGRLKQLIKASPDRAKAHCKHFSQCGGCQLQHLEEEKYYAFKKGLLETAIERAEYDSVLVEEPVKIGPFNRRRVNLKVKVAGGRVYLGFYRYRSHKIVDLEECPVVSQRIAALFAPIRKMLLKLKVPDQVSQVYLTESSGKVLMTINSAAKPSHGDRSILAEMMHREKLAGILWERNAGPFSICQAEPFILKCGNSDIVLPEKAFIQATDQGQQAIAGIIVEETSDSTRVIDLYSGCGAYSFPLLEAGHYVRSVEGDRDMVHAMQRAIESGGLESRMLAETRDLFREPIGGAELRDFDAVVVNPPRNGAEPQVEAIGKSDVPLVIIVSCNPVTLERDARILQDQGYLLKRAVPVDQFFWTTHLESVVVFYKNDDERNFF